MERQTNKGKPFTPYEDSMLQAYRVSGRSLAECARRLGRDVRSLVNRGNYLRRKARGRKASK
jgi:hypothetical protein